MDPLWSQLWTFPTVVILLAFQIIIFLSPRCSWAWVIDPPGGVGVKKPDSLWPVTRTAAGWAPAPALVLQDDEQVTVLDGGRGEGWTGGCGSVCGGGRSGVPEGCVPEPGCVWKMSWGPRVSWLCLAFDVKRRVGVRDPHLGVVGC